MPPVFPTLCGALSEALIRCGLVREGKVNYAKSTPHKSTMQKSTSQSQLRKQRHRTFVLDPEVGGEDADAGCGEREHHPVRVALQKSTLKSQQHTLEKVNRKSTANTPKVNSTHFQKSTSRQQHPSERAALCKSR
eukprot:158952-Rhodomonas_salina.1